VKFLLQSTEIPSGQSFSLEQLAISKSVAPLKNLKKQAFGGWGDLVGISANFATRHIGFKKRSKKSQDILTLLRMFGFKQQRKYC
jgi:hypothetical protein